MRTLLVALMSLPLLGLTTSDRPALRPTDLQMLTGQPWTGTLTYLDYRSNRPVSIRSTLIVSRPKGDEPVWIFDYRYPDEPKANSQETVTLGTDGTTLNGEHVVERTSVAGERLKVVTEESGMDNDRKAAIRYTYSIGATSVSIKKEVRYEDAQEYIERNRYEWTR
jgi:hypothetical protein